MSAKRCPGCNVEEGDYHLPKCPHGAEIIRLSEYAGQCEEALRFYAEPTNWNRTMGIAYYSATHKDCGDRARAALAKNVALPRAEGTEDGLSGLERGRAAPALNNPSGERLPPGATKCAACGDLFAVLGGEAGPVCGDCQRDFFAWWATAPRLELRRHEDIAQAAWMAGRSAAPAVQESAPFTKREQGESLNAIGGKPPELTDEQIMALSDDEVRALAKADGIDIEANAARWRGFLEGFRKGSARGTRYVGNAVCAPTRVLFANGRIVEIRDGALFVDRNEDEAARVFGESTPSTVNTDTK